MKCGLAAWMCGLAVVGGATACGSKPFIGQFTTPNGGVTCKVRAKGVSCVSTRVRLDVRMVDGFGASESFPADVGRRVQRRLRAGTVFRTFSGRIVCKVSTGQVSCQGRRPTSHFWISRGSVRTLNSGPVK